MKLTELYLSAVIHGCDFNFLVSDYRLWKLLSILVNETVAIA